MSGAVVWSMMAPTLTLAGRGFENPALLLRGSDTLPPTTIVVVASRVPGHEKRKNLVRKRRKKTMCCVECSYQDYPNRAPVRTHGYTGTSRCCYNDRLDSTDRRGQVATAAHAGSHIPPLRADRFWFGRICMAWLVGAIEVDRQYLDRDANQEKT